MMKTLLTIFFLICSLFSFGQGGQTVISIPDPGYSARQCILKLPSDYATATSTRYPIMIFLHGLGETSTNPSWAYNVSQTGGPAYWIATGNPSAMAGFNHPVTGAAFKYIFLTPMGSPHNYPEWAADLNRIITYMNANYRVDLSRIVLTGLSQGGGGVTYYVQREAGFVPQYKAAAFIPMESATSFSVSQTMANTIVADGVKAFGFGDAANGPTDIHGVKTKELMDKMNIASAGSAWFHQYEGGHCCWGNFYNPTFRKSITFTLNAVVYTRLMNIYEWALLWQQGAVALSSYAGPNQTIVLPTSSVSLAGSGASGQTPYSYLWTKQSGPSATITSPTAASTAVTAMSQGTYLFRLRVTDNIGTQANDDVQIIVNPATNQPPVANAGSDQTINLPVATTTLTGSGNDPDGSITAYAWILITGPGGSTIVSPTSATTNITGLVQGVYRFKLTVTDNSSQIDSDEITVNVVTPTPAGTGIKRYIVAGNGSGQQNLSTKGVFFYGPNNTWNPGDTFVIRASQNPWSYITFKNVYGTKENPIVIVNEGAVISTTIGCGTGRQIGGFALENCKNVKVISSDGEGTYGFYMTTTQNCVGEPTHSGVGFSILGRSSDIEIYGFDVYKKTYGAWAKQDASCIDSLQYPNWRMNNIKIHHNRFTNIGQDVMYIGATHPYNSSVTKVKPIVCNGVTIYPIPMRLSNVEIYNNIMDSANRTGIQISGADSGNNSIHHNTITRMGFEYNQQQGTGISIGGGAWADIYNNHISQTFIYGIFDLGVGLSRIDSNYVDSSGLLGAVRNTFTQPTNIYVAARPATPPDSLKFYVRGNTLGRNATNDSMNIVVAYDYPGQQVYRVGNIICGNTKIYYGGAPARDFVRGPSGAINVLRTGCVTLTNLCPTMSAGGDRTITLPVDSTTIEGSGVDPDGAAITFAWTKISGPATYTIQTANSNTTRVTGLVQGVYVFRLTATDDSSCARTDDVQVIVNAPVANQLPIAESGPNQTITLPTNSVTLTGSGSDFDGTISTYAWLKVSPGGSATITNPSSASTTVTNLSEATYQFQLTVTDNSGGQGTDVVTIVVRPITPPPNQPPTANAGIDFSIQLPVNSVQAIGSGIDLDGTISTYAWTKIAGPSTYTIADASNDTTAITNLVTGTYQFKLTVTDNQGTTASDILVVTVQASNLAPVSVAGINQTIIYPPTSSVTINGSSSSDPDGSISAYLWSQWDGPAATIVSPASASTSITGLTTSGTYTFRLTVTDNQGGVHSDDVDIIVNANVAPLANAGGGKVITLPASSTTLSGSASDVDGTISTYSWVKTSGPAGGTVVSPSSASTNITGLTEGNYEFTLTVTDNGGSTHSDIATIRVTKAGLFRLTRRFRIL